MIRTLTAAAMVVASAGAACAADAPPGAAACSGCHAVRPGVDSPVPRLAGRDAAQIVAAMAEFRAGQRPATVMTLVSKGFSEEEIRAVAAWYAAQKE
jgi:cytochrome c553